MHCHSFFSYNADGWSPSRVAFAGSAAAARCAPRRCAISTCSTAWTNSSAPAVCWPCAPPSTSKPAPTCAGLADTDISSPGEPGVTYIMGCGFTGLPAQGTPQAATLAQLRQGARDRNLALIARVNATLPEIAVDYARDVQPLTPKGVATERHIMRAYRLQAEKAFPAPAARASFWAPLLKCTAADYPAIEANIPKMEDLVRNALAKRGGIGYIQPDEKTFPLADDFTRWVASCGAIPTIAWLDGTSDGERPATRCST